jgi:hypothetical protein
MAQLVLPPRARTTLVADAAHPVAHAVAVRLADLGHVALAASPASPDVAAHLDHLPRETARSGVIETFSGPLEAAPDHARALFGRLDALVLTAETWAFGPTFAERFTPLPRRPIVAEALDLVRAFAGLPTSPARGAPRRRIVFVSTLPTLPFTGVGPAQQRAFDALARALRYELRLLGVDVTMLTADLVAAQPPAQPHTARLEEALGALPAASPYHGLAAPLRRAVQALSRQAPTPERVAESVVKALLRKTPKNAVRVRGRGGRLAVPIALRALDRETRRLAKET